jgi:hypothetical protein
VLIVMLLCLEVGLRLGGEDEGVGIFDVDVTITSEQELLDH